MDPYASADDGGNMYADTDEMPASEKKDQAEDRSATETALLPKAFFGNKPLEIGRECKVRIAEVLDDQVRVEYVPHQESEPAESEPEPEMADLA